MYSRHTDVVPIFLVLLQVNGSFQYEFLTEVMRNVSAAANQTLPESFYLLDVNLLNAVTGT